MGVVGLVGLRAAEIVEQSVTVPAEPSVAGLAETRRQNGGTSVTGLAELGVAELAAQD
jgi:hypothetical protein